MSRKGRKGLGVRQDYNRKKLQNPFFKHKKGRGNNRWFKCLLLGIFILIIFLVWFFLASSVWRIKEVKIEGLTRFSDSDIKNYVLNQADQRRLGVFRQNNIFLFKKDIIAQKITSNYNFSNLEVNKKLPNTIEIIIKERPYAFIFQAYAFIFQEGDELYYSSPDGYVLRETSVIDEDKERYFILENKNENSLIDQWDRINVEDGYLSFVLNLHGFLTEQPELLVDKFIIDQEFNTIKVDFKDGPIVFFNTRSEVIEQVNRLVLVKNEKIKDNFSRTDYIDLRYGDRIFLYPPIN